MKLSYRGVNYEPKASTLEVTEGEIGGQYRGQPWRFQLVRHIRQPQPVHHLKYRGVPYCTGKPATTEPRLVAQPAATVSRRMPAIQRQREILDELKLNHLRNIQRSLEHRLEVAKAKGDQHLIRLLEEESREIALHLH